MDRHQHAQEQQGLTLSEAGQEEEPGQKGACGGTEVIEAFQQCSRLAGRPPRHAEMV